MPFGPFDIAGIHAHVHGNFFINSRHMYTVYEITRKFFGPISYSKTAANTFKLILFHHAFYMYLHGLAYTFSGSMAVIVVMKASTSPQLPSSPPPSGFGGHLPILELKTWCRQASTNQVRSRFRERKRDLTYCELERERERESREMSGEPTCMKL